MSEQKEYINTQYILEDAVFEGDINKVISLLTSSNEDINFMDARLLRIALDNEDYDVISQLLQLGSDPNVLNENKIWSDFWSR